MKINSITLTNIGPYLNENIFDFTTSNDKNIILIGGENGSGKTTLLKAIKYGLFGSFSLGLKNETKLYYKEISQMLNYTALNENNYKISIDFQYNEKYVSHRYTLVRSWKVSPDSILEELEVYSGDKQLSKLDAEEVENKIRSLSSPEFIDSYIYDGEKVASIIENDEISTYIREAFNTSFGINLTNQLEKDLSSYLSKKSTELDNETIDHSVSLYNEINEIKFKIGNITKTINSNENSIKSLNTKLSLTENKFYKLGGLTKAQIKELEENIKNEEVNKANDYKKLKDIIDNDLPLIILNKDLAKASKQVENEKPFKLMSYIDSIQRYVGTENSDLSGIKELIRSKSVGVKAIHNLDEISSDKFELRAKSIKKSKKEFSDIVKGLRSRLDIFRESKDRFESISDNEEFDKILKEMDSISNNLEYCKTKASELKEELDLLNKDLDNKLAVYNKLNDEIRKNELIDNSFILGNKAIEINNLFRDAVIKNKLKKVSEYTTEIFNKTIRKDKYIARIEIDNEFNLTLYDYQDRVLKTNYLSAGEKQVLVSSVIYSMFKISGRREMFVFDTPLARLDVSNRANFINNIVKKASNQVVILSTDSEFVGNNLELVKPYVSRKYLLDYDNKTKSTEIKNDYFGGEW